MVTPFHPHMARNIEIKARIASVAQLAAVAATFANEGSVDIQQDDTFFVCPNGRLKLRTFADGRGELIFYQRADQAGPKESFFLVTPIADPEVLRESLSQAYGLAGRVVKHRILFIAGHTRIHLDQVRGLGSFLELEVVLASTQTAEEGEEEARRIMRLLSVEPEQLIDVAYVDLLQQASS